MKLKFLLCTCSVKPNCYIKGELGDNAVDDWEELNGRFLRVVEVEEADVGQNKELLRPIPEEASGLLVHVASLE